MFVNPEKILLRSALNNAEIVVDLGTGSGFYALAAAKIVGTQGKVYVVDILESALSHMAAQANLKGLKNIQTIRCDLELPSACQDIGDSGASFVIMANIISQLANKDNLMLEAYRMLKTGGKLLIVDWNKKKNPIGLSHKTKVTEDEAKKLAYSINLKFVKVVESDDYHYGLLFVK